MLVSLNKDFYLTKVNSSTYLESACVNENDIFKVIKTVSGVHALSNVKYKTRYLLKDNNVYMYSFISTSQFLSLFKVISK